MVSWIVEDQVGVISCIGVLQNLVLLDLILMENFLFCCKGRDYSKKKKGVKLNIGFKE